MKKTEKNKYLLLLPALLFFLINNNAAAQKDSVASEEIVKLKYYNENNSMQYLVTENLLKTGKKIEPVKNKTFELYLDSIGAQNLIAKVTTDNTGKAKSFLPITLKTTWDASPVHKFIATAAGKNEETAAELEITKAKIQLDTTSEDGSRNITVTVMKFENSVWVPASEVEMKVGIRRLGSILSAGDEPTYTTDSSGSIVVQIIKDSLPGDAKGNIILEAKVEDNDVFGNLMVQKTVAWGVPTKYDDSFFDQRTLWSPRFKTPFWLLSIAYGIILSVWGTLIYLITQLFKIKKLGESP